MVRDRANREPGQGLRQSPVTPHPPDSAPPGEEDPWRETFGTFVLYAAAILAYALLGMYVHFLLSWTRGFLFALAAVWGIPALDRRWRR